MFLSLIYFCDYSFGEWKGYEITFWIQSQKLSNNNDHNTLSLAFCNIIQKIQQYCNDAVFLYHWTSMVKIGDSEGT